MGIIIADIAEVLIKPPIEADFNIFPALGREGGLSNESNLKNKLEVYYVNEIYK